MYVCKYVLLRHKPRHLLPSRLQFLAAAAVTVLVVFGDCRGLAVLDERRALHELLAVRFRDHEGLREMGLPWPDSEPQIGA